MTKRNNIRIHYSTDSASNRNEYQGYLLGREGDRCLGQQTLPPASVDCLETLGA